MERLQFTEFAAKSDDARSVGNAKQGPSDNASHAELTEVAAGMDLWLGPMTLQIRIIGPDDLLLISDKSDTPGAIATPLPTTPSFLACRKCSCDRPMGTGCVTFLSRRRLALGTQVLMLA